MRLAVRLAPLVCLAAAGCGIVAQKPYVDDPLLRGGRGVWLAREPAPPTAQQPPSPPAAIEPPPPPALPTSPRWE
jgi:hypothetical protein